MKQTIKLLKALGDGTRLRIVRILMNGEQCACSIYPNVGKAQSTVSRHLKTLEEAGVVQSRRDGINIWYRLESDEAKQILAILKLGKLEIVKHECPAGPRGRPGGKGRVSDGHHP